jgi:hypothetical protein
MRCLILALYLMAAWSSLVLAAEPDFRPFGAAPTRRYPDYDEGVAMAKAQGKSLVVVRGLDAAEVERQRELAERNDMIFAVARDNDTRVRIGVNDLCFVPAGFQAPKLPGAPVPPPATPTPPGKVKVCDEYGCRFVDAPTVRQGSVPVRAAPAPAPAILPAVDLPVLMVAPPPPPPPTAFLPPILAEPPLFPPPPTFVTAPAPTPAPMASLPVLAAAPSYYAPRPAPTYSSAYPSRSFGISAGVSAGFGGACRT